MLQGKRRSTASGAAGGPVAVGIIGCGAVARLYYAPALKVLEQEGLARVVAFWDPAAEALSRIASEFPRAERLSAFTDLRPGGLDLVIVASPPRWHSEQVIAALEAGSAVLCEKPLATNLADAEMMVRAAAKAGRPLMVGLMRRFFPATRTIRAVLQARTIGAIRHFRCFEGSALWTPAPSNSYFERPIDCGALVELGPNLLDLLVWWLGSPSHIIYEDDAMGGVEANCRIRLFYDGFEGDVRLSRDWGRPNRYVFEGTTATLAWNPTEADRLQLAFTSSGFTSELLLHRSGAEGPVMRLRPAATVQQSMVEQLRNVMAAARGAVSTIVDVTESLERVRLIEHCYRHRKLLPLHWMSELEQRAAQAIAAS